MRWRKPIAHLTNVGLPACRNAFSTSNKPDVLILGGGHNGLVAATLLARQGLQVSCRSVMRYGMLARVSHLPPCPQVRVLEAKDTVGGACKTEYPFPNAPGLGTSTGETATAAVRSGNSCGLSISVNRVDCIFAGAYLLGVMPPELLKVAQPAVCNEAALNLRLLESARADNKTYHADFECGHSVETQRSTLLPAHNR